MTLDDLERVIAAALRRELRANGFKAQLPEHRVFAVARNVARAAGEALEAELPAAPRRRAGAS